MSEDEPDKNSSNIPELEVPDFHPSIPQYMVDNIKDDTSKFLIEQVSIIKQQNKWQSMHLAQVFDYTRKINGKVIELEKYRQSQEIDKQISQELKKKLAKSKKILVPCAIALATFCYPLYISLFLEAGAVKVLDLVAKVFH
jgi:hypothetical protein